MKTVILKINSIIMKNIVPNESHKKFSYFSDFSIIFMECFSLSAKDYFVVQTEEKTVYISELIDEDFKIRCILELAAKASSLHMSENLVIGCSNGSLALVSAKDILEGNLNCKPKVLDLKPSSILTVSSKKNQKSGILQSLILFHQDSSITFLERKLVEPTPFCAKQTPKQTAIDCQLDQKQEENDIDKVGDQGPTKEEGNQTEQNKKIPVQQDMMNLNESTWKIRIIWLPFAVKLFKIIPHSREQDDIYCIIYPQNSAAPLPLTQTEFFSQIPDSLVALHEQNEQLYRNVLQECYEGIQIMEYEPTNRILVMADSKGYVYISKLSKKSRQSSSQKDLKLLFEIQCIFVFFEQEPVISLSITPCQYYICYATGRRVSFYDLLQRQKIFNPLKQKPNSLINRVQWTEGVKLMLSSILTPQCRIYLYSHELPIRKVLDLD